MRRRIKLPNEVGNGHQAEEALRQSQGKLDQARSTQREVERVRDQFARSLERAMRRSHG